ncbi:tetratricopeptide repeat protein [bacterium]|nr:tetratricopeptide repeat protein [bacterium]
MAPESAEEHFARAEKLAWEDENYPEAKKEYARALEIDPKMAKAYLRLGQSEFKDYSTGDLKKAEEAIQKAVELNPDSADSHRWLGMVLTEQHQDERALACYENAIRLNPNDAPAFFWLGSSLMKLQKFPEMVKAFEQAAYLRPKSTGALMRLADAYVLNKQVSDAIRTLEQILQMEPVDKDDKRRARHELKRMYKRYNKS